MKANRPLFVLFSVLAIAGVFTSCQTRHEALKIGLSRVTHVRAGKSVRLSAYQVYKAGSSDPDAAQAASDGTLRETISPVWSVSDNSVATVGEDGTLTALKPGRITVKGVWEKHIAEQTIDVVKDLSVDSLPQLSSQGTDCKPQSAALSLSPERTLKFQLSFADDRCREASLEAVAPDHPLPWKFEFPSGTLELTEVQGLVVKGAARIGNAQVSFIARSEGSGIYPISLANKTVLLTGDSMSEGIGWSMKKKVSDAGGRLIVIPWYSSSTVGWQAERRMTEYIQKYNPDVVFLALGSNEIFITNLEARAKAVRDIDEEIGERPAYWIGPPSWKPDKGIVRTIEENFRPNHFYNSNDLVVPRRSGGAHPTNDGYATWTDLIWDWYARNG